MSAPRVVVVGGGIIGASSAYYLRKAGYDVTIVEKGKFGSACSHGNCGYVCPSHVLPLAAPGAIWSALGSLFKKNSPLYIKPRLELTQWIWLLKFALKCNLKDMSRSAEGIHRLLQLSLQEYQNWRTAGINCEWQDSGLLFVYRTNHEFEEYEKTDRYLRARFDVGAVRWNRDELCQREPAVKPDVAGAWFYEGDAQLRPDVLMRSLRNWLDRQGVKILENTACLGFRSENGRATGVRIEQRILPADYVVLSTGAWCPRDAKALGMRIPIQPGKGYSITMTRPATCPTRPMIFHEDRVACTVFDGSYRLGSTMEFSGYDEQLNRNRLDILTRVAGHYLKEPTTTQIQEEWFGLRPMTYDGLPIIDFSPALSNVVVASGHGMLGISMGPGTGRLVSEMIAQTKPAIDCSCFSAARFN